MGSGSHYVLQSLSVEILIPERWSGRGRQLFYRRPQPNLLKHCRMPEGGRMPDASAVHTRVRRASSPGVGGIQLDEP